MGKRTKSKRKVFKLIFVVLLRIGIFRRKTIAIAARMESQILKSNRTFDLDPKWFVLTVNNWKKNYFIHFFYQTMPYIEFDPNRIAPLAIHQELSIFHSSFRWEMFFLRMEQNKHFDHPISVLGYWFIFFFLSFPLRAKWNIVMTLV